MNNKKSIEFVLISSDDTLLQALKCMDNRKLKLLVIIDDKDRYLNLLSIGDIQRSILQNISLETKIKNIEIEKKIVAYDTWTEKQIKNFMLKIRTEFMPVLNQEHHIIKIYFWNDFFNEPQFIESIKKIDIPVVLMAGGKGTRLKPISNIIPKPLVPIGDVTIIEEIIGRFKRAGCTNYFISVNYKEKMIASYLNDVDIKNVSLNFIKEEKPLGTAGSLSLLKGKINTTFFISNCDILIDQDLVEIFEYHKKNKNEITMVSALKHISIAYGTIETGEDGILETMVEKPELTFKINTGVYILEPELIDEVPNDKFYHITELIEQVKNRGGRVGVFPISEKSWLDIGEWPEYIKTVRALSDGENFKGL